MLRAISPERGLPANRLTENLSERPVSHDRDEAWSQRIERLLGEYPIATLAAGVVVGIAVGWLVKRR